MGTFDFSGYISSTGVVDTHLHCDIIPTVTSEGISPNIIYIIEDEATLTGNNNIAFTLGISQAEFDSIGETIEGKIALKFYYEFK
ncbi:MAG: hypothetical protein MJ219_02615 [Mycoplasmoidaceae bacterium]|nr:hypothetical protein [Mycoplasmoidaceae bacterium]